MSPENAERIAAIERFKVMERQQKALLSASQRDDVRAVENILASGADVNYGNSVGQTALHIACIWGNASAADLLIEAGANVNAKKDLSEQTPVHMVASRGTNPANRLVLAKQLVAAGANLNAQDLAGDAPYQLLAEDEFPELLEVLTPKGGW